MVRRPAELRALRSPVRQQLTTILNLRGPCSVGELAQHMGRSAESLYYHVQKLVRAGLVTLKEERPTARRPEAVYELVAPGILVDPKQRSAAFLAELGELYGSVLRKTARDLTRTLERDRHLGPEQQRHSALLFYEARLKPASLKKLRRMLFEVVDFLAQEDDPEGELHSVTLAYALDTMANTGD